MKLTTEILVVVLSALPFCDGAFVGRSLGSSSFSPWQRASLLSRRFAEPSGTEDGNYINEKGADKESITPKGLNAFVNDGPFSWLMDYLFLHQPGKSMAFGIPIGTDKSRETSIEQIAQSKSELARNLMNIGMEERERRRQAGNIFVAVTAVYALWAALIADHGDFQGHVLRFMTFLPMFFALGYKESAKQGLCNIAQRGSWEVDGIIQAVDDPDLARALLEKVNELNFETILKVVVVSAAFAVLPQSASVPLAFFAALFVGKLIGRLLTKLLIPLQSFSDSLA